MRIFYAITFSNKTKAVLSRYRDLLANEADKGRFIATENIHLTLEYIGEVKAYELNRYNSYLDELVDFPKTLTINKLGKFTKKERDIIWLGLEKNQELLKLQKALLEALNKDGFKSKQQKFTPHITLGRQVLMAQDAATIHMEPISVEVRSIALMESIRVNDMLVYEPIDEIILGGQDGEN